MAQKTLNEIRNTFLKYLIENLYIYSIFENPNTAFQITFLFALIFPLFPQFYVHLLHFDDGTLDLGFHYLTIQPTLPLSRWHSAESPLFSQLKTTLPLPQKPEYNMTKYAANKQQSKTKKQAREIEQESGTVWHILWHCRAHTLLGTVARLFNPASVHCTLVVHLTSCLYRAADQ